jgi:hypothetical protein
MMGRAENDIHYVRQVRNAYKILVAKSEEKRPEYVVD